MKTAAVSTAEKAHRLAQDKTSLREASVTARLEAIAQFKQSDRVYNKLTRQNGYYYAANMANAMPDCWVKYEILIDDEWRLSVETPANPLNLELCTEPSHCSQEWQGCVKEASNLPDLVTNSESPSLSKSPSIAEKSLPSTTPTLSNTTTCEHSTPKEEASTLFVEEYPASHSPTPESAKPETTSEICSLNFLDCFAKFDQDGRLLKMSQGYSQSTLDGISEEYSGNLPRMGTMSSGKLYPAKKWVESTAEKESLLLPTPTVTDATAGQIIGKNDTFKMTKNAKSAGTNPSSGELCGKMRKHSQTGSNGSLGLGRYVQMLPTPKAQDGIHPGVKNCKPGQTMHLSAAVMGDGLLKKKLSVNFVEKIMGFPIDWTSLCDTKTSQNGLIKPQIPMISPIEKNGSKLWGMPSSVTKLRSPGEELPSLLTIDEERDFAHLERKVERAFYEAGKALEEIRDRKLYRASHKTFEAYCKDRFGFSRTYPYRLIDAAAVVDNLSPIGQQNNLFAIGEQKMPTTERQVRALVSLQPEEQRQIWLEAVEKSNGKVPSGATVKGIVERIKEKTFIPLPDRCEYFVGDVVTIHAKGNSTLRGLDGYWGIIERISDYAYHVCISVKGEMICKGDEMKRLEIGQQDREDIKAVSDRVRDLAIRDDLDSSAWWILEGLSRQTCFSQKQMALLEFLEKQYGI